MMFVVKAHLHQVVYLFLLLLLTMVATSNTAFSQSPKDIPVEAFSQLPAIDPGIYFTAGKLSPGGRYFMSIRSLNGEKALVIEDLFGELPPYIMPPIEGFKISHGMWATDTRFLLVVTSRGLARYSNGQVSTIEITESRLLAGNVDQSNTLPIVKPSKDKASGGRGVPGTFPPPKDQSTIIDMMWDDPDHIMMSIDGDHDGSDEVRLIDINDGSFREIGTGMVGAQSRRTDWNGEIRYVYGVQSGRSDDIIRLIRLSGSEDFFSWYDTAAGKRGGSLLGFTQENPNMLYVHVPYLDAPGEIWLYDLEADEMKELVFGDNKYEDMSIVEHPYSQQYVGYRITRDYTEIEYFNATFERVQRLVDSALADTQNLITSASRDLTMFSIYSRSGSNPGTYYILDYANKQLIPWVNLYEGLEPTLMADVKKVAYPARDGTDLDAYLFIPNGSKGKNLPTVIMPHGGPHARDTMEFDYWAQFLASRGYAVIQPQFRGTEGYNYGFEDAGRNEWGGLMQDDVTDATEWMISEGIADPDKICIVGGSYGGYAALMGAIKTPDLFQCAASINGVTDLGRMITYDKQFIGGQVWTRSIGENGNINQVSPTQRADEIKIPILLIQAENDERVPMEQIESMMRALDRADIPYDAIMMEDGGHTLDTSAARYTTLSALERFLGEHLN